MSLGAPAPRERGDAARNRRLLLDAAAALVTELGACAVTMDAVAARAGVGKGTVFRRFGNRAGLMRALLDQTETDLQEAFLTGPPPLGPGAPPLDRLVAFGRARLAVIDVQGEVVLEADESPTDRFAVPARFVALTHVRMLLASAGVRGDLHLLAESLLAPLDAALVMHQLRERGIPLDRIAQGWADLVQRVAGSPEPRTTVGIDAANEQ
ncbi:TetR family transcriptional regulator [Rhodococcus rhodnii]|uniref:TetR family transcriptional regulator n=1 Tax=Rhodococcus rhodnii TaxID=38312 RepID=A0A6P2CL91_9NOCA|nr:TetR family transcriptional regulator [Rhodococcus rhodnii]